jgi:hypothetical protein
MTTNEKRYSMYMDYYLPQDGLHQIRESIRRNHAKCSPRYWPHNVTFVPDDSSNPIYRKIYERYLQASETEL